MIVCRSWLHVAGDKPRPCTLPIDHEWDGVVLRTDDAGLCLSSDGWRWMPGRKAIRPK